MALKSGDVKRVYDVVQFTAQTAGATNLVAPLETTGYASMTFQINGATTPVVTVFTSNDNVTYNAGCSLIDRQSTTPATRVATGTVTGGFYSVQLNAAWTKIVLTSIVSGTAIGSAIFTSEQATA